MECDDMSEERQAMDELTSLQEQLAEARRQLEQEKTQTWGAVNPTTVEAQQLRDQLAAVAVERDSLRQQQASAQRRHGKLTSLGPAELKSKLEKCVEEHRVALVAGQFEEAAALSETTQKLTAALRDASESEAAALWRGS